jgi:hypothetical protein
MNGVHPSARRVPRRGARLVALVVVILVLLSARTVTASAAAITTSSVLQSATRAIAQQAGAHVAFVAHSSSSSTTEKIIADVGATSGSETLSEGKAQLAIRVTPADAYVRGSSSGLTTLFGLTASQAKKLGTKWESWKAGTKQYSNLKGDLTMSSVSSLLPKPKGTTLSTEVAGGAKVYVLTWTVPATKSIPALSDTLTISAVGPFLPTEETETADGVRVTTQLSKWGEHVTVLAPPVASTVASSTITG